MPAVGTPVSELYRHRYRRVPPLRHCDLGHEWRAWSQACPDCAKASRDGAAGESLREFRRRVIDPSRNRATD